MNNEPSDANNVHDAASIAEAAHKIEPPAQGWLEAAKDTAAQQWEAAGQSLRELKDRYVTAQPDLAEASFGDRATLLRAEPSVSADASAALTTPADPTVAAASPSWVQGLTPEGIAIGAAGALAAYTVVRGMDNLTRPPEDRTIVEHRR